MDFEFERSCEQLKSWFAPRDLGPAEDCYEKMLPFQAGVMILLIGMFAACTRFDFERYNAGTAELWIGVPVQVEQECVWRGTTTLAMDSHILGCTDFESATIISISDPKVIAHEYCHWSPQTASHQLCPMP